MLTHKRALIELAEIQLEQQLLLNQVMWENSCQAKLSALSAEDMFMDQTIMEALAYNIQLKEESFQAKHFAICRYISSTI